MRAGQYTDRLCSPRQLGEGVQDRPRLRHGRRPLEGLAHRLVGAEALEIPRVELAQVAPGARGAEVLDGTVHDPVELPEDLLGTGVVVAPAEQLGEQPRVAER